MLKHLVFAGLAGALMAGMAVADGAGEEEDGGNDVEILLPPRPVYPSLAGILGIEGVCEVHFALLGGGDIIDIDEVSCSHPIFCDTARESVLQARFRVIDVPGAKHAGERDNLVYPLSFLLSEHEQQWPALQVCTSDLVS